MITENTNLKSAFFNRKLKSAFFLMASIYFMVAEFISAVFTNRPLIEVYTQHTISALGVPFATIGFSPLYHLMNSGFIALGIFLILGCVFGLNEKMRRYKKPYNILVAITSLGLFIIAFIHAGDSFHQIGALMAIVGGGLLLMTIAIGVEASKNYKIACLILGVMAIGFLMLMIYFMGNPSLEIIEAIPERISVYSLILWSFITGIMIIKE